jgi:uncharacterized protein (DUF2141 family)
MGRYHVNIMAPDYRVMNRLRRAITIVCVPMRKGPFYIWRYLGVVTALSFAIAAFDRVAAAAGPDTFVKTENRLLVRVLGLRNDHGDVRCSLFSSAEDFPNNGDLMAKTVTAPIVGRTATCEFAGTAPGVYAVVLFHDENGDGKFNRNWIGLPEEGYGFSNDAPARFHPPRFDDASFSFAGGTLEIPVKIRY